MKERGKVVEARSGTIVIEVKPHEECHKCGICGAGRPRRVSVSGEKAHGFSVGDTVEIAMESSMMLKLYTLLYGIPLAVFTGTILALYALSGAPVASFAGALAATIITYAGAGLYIRKNPGLSPRVTKKQA